MLHGWPPVDLRLRLQPEQPVDRHHRLFVAASSPRRHIVKRSSGRHSERLAVEEWALLGLDPSSLKGVYTELAPCVAFSL
ncbi:nucleic acid/nucleotide deaminase domain-containing protein [Streptomyces sp. NPDC048337]|uniref:nucleic acid/nucleotide deaminase domain-containing protein n=1 Tax=Streptomyces sp. NPDC048337 TaxID=3365535 RepID=UPI00371A4ED9